MGIPRRVDRIFFFIVAGLVISGFLIFLSASMGLWTREDIDPGSLAFKQIAIGLVGGIIAATVTSRMHYAIWRKYSLILFVASVALTLLVFVPGIGFSHGGAARWIAVGNLTFQPSELLKLSFVIYLAALLSKFRNRTLTFRESVIPFFILTGISAVILFKQPDIDTLAVMFFTGLCMLIAAGAKWRDVGIVFLIALIGFGLLTFAKPYVKERFLTFFNPERDALGAGYQLQQSLIAIGSGGLLGRGFGQSVQKFGPLPEPVGDSIFSVAAEEFGFIGSTVLILLFTLFLIRGLKIASGAPERFGRLLSVGIVILIVSQSFLNIGAMLGVLPLSGIPLLFVSHGGTALLVTLAQVGIVFNVSKYWLRNS